MTTAKTLRVTVVGTAAALLLGAFGAAPAFSALGDGPLQVIPAGDTSGDGFVAAVSTTQAGAHADGSTRFRITPVPTFQEHFEFGAPLKTNVIDLPPGLIGNPQAVPTCSAEQLNGGGIEKTFCPRASQVGIIEVWSKAEVFPGGPSFSQHATTTGLYAMDAPPDALAELAFKIVTAEIHIVASVRPDDYGLRLTTRNISRSPIPLWGVTATVWGTPADPSHDEQRCDRLNETINICDGTSPFFGGTEGIQNELPQPAGVPVTPFLSNPTVCDGPKLTTITVDSWLDPGDFHSTTDTDPTPTGCDQLDFNPTIEADPTTNLADSPSGLDFNLHIPQNLDPDGLATAHLKDAVVTLPKGMTVNPSSANGLGACSEAQIGLGVDSTNTCPNASKLGTVQIDTPVLENPVPGAIYLAEQNNNPFNSLLALYIAARLPNGQEVKIPGRVEADPITGQLEATFKDNPQLPFEDLRVNFFGGSRASLKTPQTCGTFTTNTQMTPWTSPEGADAFPSDSFEITQGAGGGTCIANEAAAPNQPSFSAGTVDPTAGAYAPFTLKLARADGTQAIKGIDTTLPKGLIGKLAGVPYCSDAALVAAAGKSGKAEQASSSCPAASQVGEVNVAAGAGPAPLNVGAKAYLAGPYKGAPLSLAIITPAVAGPFDLGTVLVRTALYVDSISTQIHAVSDPIPTILQGIPLDVRTISLNMARPKFTLNPTSCDPMAITGSALSVFDQSAALFNRFQVGDCGRLAFKPKLALKLKGGTKRDDNPALTAVLTYPEGAYANIASASVALPHSAFLDQSHIKTICTRVQFAVDACPAGSVYGFARAFSPLLDQPLEGPVYLRSSNNPLPDLLIALKGQIDVDLAGRIDSVKGGGIRTTFDAAPDAPVSKFVLMMKGGKKGLLVNSRDICQHTYRVTASFSGQNGKTFDSRPVLGNSCKKTKKKHKHRGKPHKKG